MITEDVVGGANPEVEGAIKDVIEEEKVAAAEAAVKDTQEVLEAMAAVTAATMDRQAVKVGMETAVAAAVTALAVEVEVVDLVRMVEGLSTLQKKMTL